jgi:hypothetical protein
VEKEEEVGGKRNNKEEREKGCVADMHQKGSTDGPACPPVRLGCSGSVGQKFRIFWMKNKYRRHGWARFLSPASPYSLCGGYRGMAGDDWCVVDMGASSSSIPGNSARKIA